MAIVRQPDFGGWDPGFFLNWARPPAFDGPTIDATGEKIAWCGKFWHPNGPGTYDLVRGGLRLHTVVKAGGSAMTFSLQDVSTSATAPIQPDETPDQTVAIANADAAFVSSTWYRTGILSAARSVAFGEYVAAVLEFDGAGRLGSDSVRVSGIMRSGLDNASGLLLKAPSFAAQNGQFPGIVLEDDDGNFGCILGSPVASAISSFSFDSADSPDEYANTFQVVTPRSVDAIYGFVRASNAAANFDLGLYEGTTLLGAVSVDANQLTALAEHPGIWPIGDEIELAVGPTYNLAVLATTTTANGVNVFYRDVADAKHLAFGGMSLGSLVSRTDGGAWGSPVTTRQLMLGLRPSGFSDGAGGGPVARQSINQNIGTH